MFYYNEKWWKFKSKMTHLWRCKEEREKLAFIIIMIITTTISAFVGIAEIPED